MANRYRSLAVLAVLCCSALAVTIPCNSIDQVYCEVGDWANPSDSEIDGEWWPSRSTHYGSTNGGACGMGVYPNCLSKNDSGCSSATTDLLNNDYKGKYAAPQGGYYSQTGGYLSCGECFQVRCYDPLCSYRGAVNLRIADSCPCNGNGDWCCGDGSACTALNPADDGSKHCPKWNVSVWDECRSIHLDLSDVAYREVVLGPGANSSTNVPGAINTYARRVSCNVTGNVYIITTNEYINWTSDCTRVYPDTAPCFHYLSVAIVNVAGAGSITSVNISAYHIINNTNQPGSAVQEWLPMHYDNDSIYLAKPQEIYGQWKTPENTWLFFPMKFRMRNRFGQEVVTDEWSSESDYKRWWNTGVQFPAVPTERDLSKCLASSSASSAHEAVEVESSLAQPTLVSSDGPAVAVQSSLTGAAARLTAVVICFLALFLAFV